MYPHALCFKGGCLEAEGSAFRELVLLVLQVHSPKSPLSHPHTKVPMLVNRIEELLLWCLRLDLRVLLVGGDGAAG